MKTEEKIEIKLRTDREFCIVNFFLNTECIRWEELSYEDKMTIVSSLYGTYKKFDYRLNEELITPIKIPIYFIFFIKETIRRLKQRLCKFLHKAWHIMELGYRT